MTNNTKNVWDQMVLFNQLTLCNILNWREDLGTPKLRAAVASLTSEQRDNTICFLKCSTEELTGCLKVKAYRQWSMSAPYWTTFQ